MVFALSLWFVSHDVSSLTVGDSWVANVSQSLVPDVAGDQPEILNFTQSAKVTKPDQVQISRKLISTFIGTQKLPIPSDNEPMQWQETWIPSALAIRSLEAEDPGQLRLDRVIQLPYFRDRQPIHQSLPMIGNAKAPAAEADWKFLPQRSTRLERNTTKASFSYTERGGVTATGTAWIDNRTGLPLYAKIVARNAPAPGGNGEPNIFTYEYDVTELKLKHE